MEKDLKYEVKKARLMSHRRRVFEGTMRLRFSWSLFRHLQVKMTDPKGSDLVVTNLRTEEVVPKSQYICSSSQMFFSGSEWSSCGEHDAPCWQDESSGKKMAKLVVHLRSSPLFGRFNICSTLNYLQKISHLDCMCRPRPYVTSGALEATVCSFWRLRDTTHPPWRLAAAFWTWFVLPPFAYFHPEFELEWIQCRLTWPAVSVSRRVAARVSGWPRLRCFLVNNQIGSNRFCLFSIQAINKSLSNLGQVIMALSQKVDFSTIFPRKEL